MMQMSRYRSGESNEAHFGCEVFAETVLSKGWVAVFFPQNILPKSRCLEIVSLLSLPLLLQDLPQTAIPICFTLEPVHRRNYIELQFIYLISIMNIKNMTIKAIQSKGPANILSDLLKSKKIQQYAERYCYKGFAPHYRLYQNLPVSQVNKEEKIFCFQKEAATLALEMAARRKKTLTYISDTRYETVTIIPKVLTSKSNLSEEERQFEEHLMSSTSRSSPSALSIPKDISQAASYIIQNYRFVVKNGFLDNHPFESYKKLCGYILLKRDPKITSIFQSHQVNQSILNCSFLLLPFLSELRSTYLMTDKLKLKTLPRREGVQLTEGMQSDYLRKWRDIVQFGVAEQASRTFDEQVVLEWGLQNKLGSIVSLEAVLNGKFQHYHYATWL